eukprot:4495219-Pleurochrysis_carterae.AAC.1
MPCPQLSPTLLKPLFGLRVPFLRCGGRTSAFELKLVAPESVQPSTHATQKEKSKVCQGRRMAT